VNPNLTKQYGGGFGVFGATSQLGVSNVPRPSYTNATTGSPANSGTVYLVAYYLPAGTPVTNITFFTGTGTLKTGGTHGWYVFVTADLKIRAVSADQTDAATKWGSASTAYPLPVLTSTSSVYNTLSSGLCYLGIMVANSGGTQPNLVSGPSMAAGVAGTAVGSVISAPCTGGTGTGQTTPPTADGSVQLVLGTQDGAKNFLCWVT
jgi:hypothetical protein